MHSRTFIYVSKSTYLLVKLNLFLVHTTIHDEIFIYDTFIFIFVIAHKRIKLLRLVKRRFFLTLQERSEARYNHGTVVQLLQNVESVK